MKLEIQNREIQQLKGKLFYIGLLTLTTVVIWILLSVYSAFSKTTIDPEMQKLIKPLNPSLDSEVLQTYKDSRIIPPEQFEILAVVSQDVTTKTFQKLNPFTQTVSVVPPTSSSSAALSAR